MSDTRFIVDVERGYTVVPNPLAQDPRLSVEALGALTKMLSLPPEWDFTVRGLCTICGCGKTIIQRVLREMEEAGYLTRRQLHGENGKFGGNEYIVRSVSDIPLAEKPPAGKPSAGNRPQYNKQVTNKQRIQEPPFIPPTVEAVRAYCQEKGSSVDPEKFVNFYESKGWMVGRNKMRNWKAAVATWGRPRGASQKPGGPQGGTGHIIEEEGVYLLE